MTDHDTTTPTEPRAFIRVFVGPEQLEATIAFYERLQNTTVSTRFEFAEVRLKLAVVGAFLIIAGSDDDLRPFRSTVGTLLVDDVRPYHDKLVAAGAEIVFPLQQSPTGMTFNAVHPDGTVVEYVHQRPPGA